jgi:IS5 family transposase
MLRLQAEPVDTLWDLLLPEEARRLPQDLDRIDKLLLDSRLLAPFQVHWDRRAAELQRPLASVGRPTIAMATYLRMMLIKQRMGWGYETLIREVSDSLHLRRFCLIPLSAPVPDESTVRKLTRRLGPELVDQLIRGIIEVAIRERRFRPRAMRCDSTVVEADIRYPTDAGLAGDAVRTLAKAARQVRTAVPDTVQHVRDRTRSVSKRLRMMTRTLRRRTGEAKTIVEAMTKQAAALVEVSLRESKRLLVQARSSRSRVRGVSRRARERAIRSLEELVSLAERVVEQVRQRFARERIGDRLVSLFDTDARPVRRGKLGHPNEFGYVVQLTELTAHTRRGARGLILPPKLQAGSTHENQLLPRTVRELVNLDLNLKEAAFDAGFGPNATTAAMAEVSADVFIAGNDSKPRSLRSRRRLARYRVGSEGRISHLKRAYSSGRSRLKGRQGAEIWTGWAILAYNLDTVAGMGTRAR